MQNDVNNTLREIKVHSTGRETIENPGRKVRVPPWLREALTHGLCERRDTPHISPQILSHTMHQSNDYTKLNPPQNRQLIVYNH